MRRIMLTIAYDGTEYVGWQLQPNGLAVEEVLNKALSELTGEQIQVIGASRTDSGVHSKGNVAVFDTESRIPADKFCFAVNQHLPENIVAVASCEVPESFHPRKVKCTKTYEYTIFNAVHPDPLKARYSYFLYLPLDVAAMKQAAEYIVGEHDFASFCSAHGQQKTTVRTIYSLDVECFDEAGEKKCPEYSGTHGPCAGNVRITISGNGFLYNMVRIIVGTLVKVGLHVYPASHVKEIIEACNRDAAGPKAPAKGLVLKKIEYEKNEEGYVVKEPKGEENEESSDIDE